MTTSRNINLEPSGIGEAVRHGLSPWFIKLRFEDSDDTPLSERSWPEANRPLSPLPARIGNRFEKEVYEDIEPKANNVVDSWYEYDNQEKNEEKLIKIVGRNENRRAGSRPEILEQAKFSGIIGQYSIAGDADLLLVWPTEEGVHIRVIDIKSSWKEKTYQQIQAATYTILLRDILEETDIDFEISAGILYRESSWDEISQETLPNFTLKPREDDVKRLLSEDGPFSYAFDRDFEEIDLDIIGESPTSSYGDIYSILGVESKSLSLVGLSRGEQAVLKKNGIEDIEDLAELVETVEDGRPYGEEPDIRRKFRDTARDVEETRGLSERLPVLSQRAQAILNTINPEHEFAQENSYVEWLQGVREANLPEDEPKYDADDMNIAEGSMIRVYLSIQNDYIRDNVYSIGATVDCAVDHGDEESFSECIDIIKVDESADKKAEKERELLESTVTNLFDIIQDITLRSGQGGTAPIHFYFYTESERESLVDALNRHDTENINAMRDLLGQREGIEQSIHSIIQPEVERCLARKTPNSGLIPIYEQVNPMDDEDKVKREEWTYTRDSDGVKVDLRSAFRTGLFNSRHGFVREDDTINFPLSTGSDYDGWMSILPNYDAQIPLEYAWAAVGPYEPWWSNEERTKALIENYVWVNRGDKETKIVKEDVEKVTELLSRCVKHVERSLIYKDTEIEKKEINTVALSKYRIEDNSLATACQEYLDLEYNQTRRDALKNYDKPVKQRILDGESVPLRVTNIEKMGWYGLRIEGELIYDSFTFKNPEQVAASSKIGGSGEVSGGDYMVMSPLELTPDGYETDVFDNRDIESSPPAIVQSFDPMSGSITVEAYKQGDLSENRYSTWVKSWTTEKEKDGSNYHMYIEEGQELILDMDNNQKNMDKATIALENSVTNKLYQDIDNILQKNKDELPRKSFEDDGIDEWIDWSEHALEFSPNRKQRKFIRETDNKVSLLQGPPGTGKTSGALSHSIVSRVLGYEKENKSFRGAIIGASNKAVDEVLEDVAELVGKYNEENDELKNLNIIRLVLDDGPANGLDNVQYINYNDKDSEELADIKDWISHEGGTRQTGLDSYGEENNNRHTLIFGTPARIQKMIKNLPKVTLEDAYIQGSDYFDLLAADEASMLQLHQLFMCSAFVDDTQGQVLLTGDHRQMPPVQRYDWKNETRRNIVENVPYLSVLNYFRFLRGEDDIERVDDSVDQPDASIPITRLKKTYRCHTKVTEFLKQWIYLQDNIDYTSDETDVITVDESKNEGIVRCINPNEPLTVLVHNDRTSRQSNPTEAEIISSIMDALPEDQTKGIVTPHNSQKGLLTTMCGDDATIDTVERFQGGEKDIMILSSTVSDPDYLEDESEFILDPNRLNVALSRMKKKLIVVVPQSLFEMIPSDIDEYDRSMIWKGLRSQAGIIEGRDVWSGTVGDFSDSDNENELKIYYS